MTSETPSIDFGAARMAMIDSQLRPQGIADPLVLAAFQSVPREAYVADGAQSLAYGDRGAPSKGGGALTPAPALAAMIQALEPQPGERAMLVGTDTAYAGAVLAAMGVETVGGTDGVKVDLILIDGAVEHIPDELPDRLLPGGRLAAAVREDGVTRLVLGRHSGGSFGLTGIGDAYVPPLAGFERPRAFVF